MIVSTSIDSFPDDYAVILLLVITQDGRVLCKYHSIGPKLSLTGKMPGRRQYDLPYDDRHGAIIAFFFLSSWLLARAVPQQVRVALYNLTLECGSGEW